MAETVDNFEKRKRDHIAIALDPRAQAEGGSGLERISLQPEALPDLNLSDVQIHRDVLGVSLASPFFISSMTAGHQQGVKINAILAQAAQARGWLMGVGSQRRELNDPDAVSEWRQIRKLAPNVGLIGNLGISQVIQAQPEQIQKLVDQLEAKALFIHLNGLQECLQPEGTPQFASGAKAIEKLTKTLSVPVIVKEVGCGFSRLSLSRLDDLGLYAVDISGFGGTHWGRIEGYRSEPASLSYKIAETFRDWGVSTLESALNAQESLKKTKVWGSGGVRSGLDGAKLFALGAELVGVAQPILVAVVQDIESGRSEYEPDCALDQKMKQFEQELRIAMFCTGCRNLQEMNSKKVWQWKS